MDLAKEDVRVLADLGFLALSRGLDQHAMAIFRGVEATRPEQEAGPLGIALVHMLRGELDVAIKILRGLGPSDAARTFLGIALARLGEAEEAEFVLKDIASTAKDTSFGRLADETLASIAGDRQR